MNALNEVNRVISSVSYYPSSSSASTSGPGSLRTGSGGGGVGPARLPGTEEEDFLTADRMAEWLKENKVLQITLQDSLHQPQYVEKLEKVIR